MADSFEVRRCRVRVELASINLSQAERNLNRYLRAGDAVSDETVDVYRGIVSSAQADLELAQINLEEALYNQNPPNAGNQ